VLNSPVDPFKLISRLILEDATLDSLVMSWSGARHLPNKNQILSKAPFKSEKEDHPSL